MQYKHPNLKLVLKSTFSSTIFLVHINNGTSQLMSHHTGVPTSDVVTQGIVDEGILVLKVGSYSCHLLLAHWTIHKDTYRSKTTLYYKVLTNVCTICFLLVLISLTNSKMLRSSLSFSLSIIASRVMKVPVRPTPALQSIYIQCNYREKFICVNNHYKHLPYTLFQIYT